MSRLRRSLPYLLAALLGIIVVLLLVDKFGNFGKKAVETVAATPGAQTEISVTGPAAAPPIVKITTPTVAPAEKWYAMPIPAGLWKADVAGDQALVIPRGDNQPALTVVCHPEVTGTSPEGLFERKCKIVN